MGAREARGTRILMIDPRRTAIRDGADMHLARAPGSNVALFNDLLAQIHEQGGLDAGLNAHMTGFDGALDAARTDDADATGLCATHAATLQHKRSGRSRRSWPRKQRRSWASRSRWT